MGDIANGREDKLKGKENSQPLSSSGSLPSLLQGSESVAPTPQKEASNYPGSDPTSIARIQNNETRARLLRAVESSNVAQRLQRSEREDAADPESAPAGLEEGTARAPTHEHPITKGPPSGADSSTSPSSPQPQIEKPTMQESSNPKQVEAANGSTTTPSPKPPIDITPQHSLPRLSDSSKRQRYELVEDHPSWKSAPSSAGSGTIDSAGDMSPLSPPEPVERPRSIFSRWNNQLRRLTSKIGKESFQKLRAPKNSRRNPRLLNPPVVAFFWTGDLPEPHHIANISASGLYMLTPDCWSPGTRLSLNLRRTDREPDSAGSRLAVDFVILRKGSDGVGGAFLPDLQGGAAGSEDTLDQDCATKRDLDQFVSHLAVSDHKSPHAAPSDYPYAS